jgi:hypothetical protein
MIPQVDEEQPTMIPDAVAPTGQANLLPDVGRTKISTAMGAIAVHGTVS